MDRCDKIVSEEADRANERETITDVFERMWIPKVGYNISPDQDGTKTEDQEEKG